MKARAVAELQGIFHCRLPAIMPAVQTLQAMHRDFKFGMLSVMMRHEVSLQFLKTASH